MDTSEEVTFEEFQRIRIHAGTIVEAVPNPQARVPAYVLRIDFGPLGLRTSSAQITRHYTPQDLVGRQVAAVMNFPPKRVAGVKSEVLVPLHRGYDCFRRPERGQGRSVWGRHGPVSCGHSVCRTTT